jgi:hypothetical protein
MTDPKPNESRARDEAAAIAMLSDMFRKRNERNRKMVQSLLQVWVVVGIPSDTRLELATGNPDDEDRWIIPRYPSVSVDIGDSVLTGYVRDRVRVILNLTRVLAGLDPPTDGGVSWSDITGNIEDNADLVDALSGKADATHHHPGTGDQSVAIGEGAVSDAQQSIAIGRSALADDNDAVAIGDTATAQGVNSVAIGDTALATGGNSIAMGDHAKASSYSVAIGPAAEADAAYSESLGYETSVPSTSPRSMAIGATAEVPASTPDTAVAKFNDVMVVRSNGSGTTRVGLISPDGTVGWITVTDTDGILVNGSAPTLDTESVQDVIASTLANTDTYEWAYDDGAGTLTLNHSLVELIRRIAIDGHLTSTANPHGVTKTQVGLGAVPNTDATARSSHTGTQLASTISDFDAAAGAAINAASVKATPVDADTMPLSDSAASGGLKKLSFTNIKAFLKTYFDGVYAPLTTALSLSLHTANTSNPHAVTKTQVSLGNVDNVSVLNHGIDVMVGPFYANDLAASADVEGQLAFFNTATALSRSGNGVRMGRAGRFMGILVSVDAARTAGSLTVRPRINGFPETAITAVIDGTNTTSNSTFSTSGNTFPSSATIELSFLTASWGPTTANATAWAVVRLDSF